MLSLFYFFFHIGMRCFDLCRFDENWSWSKIYLRPWQWQPHSAIFWYMDMWIVHQTKQFSRCHVKTAYHIPHTIYHIPQNTTRLNIKIYFNICCVIFIWYLSRCIYLYFIFLFLFTAFSYGGVPIHIQWRIYFHISVLLRTENRCWSEIYFYLECLEYKCKYVCLWSNFIAV